VLALAPTASLADVDAYLAYPEPIPTQVAPKRAAVIAHVRQQLTGALASADPAEVRRVLDTSSHAAAAQELKVAFDELRAHRQTLTPAVAATWLRVLSVEALEFSGCDTVVHRPGSVSSHPSALVRVQRQQNKAFVMAVEVQNLPRRCNSFSFGVAHSRNKSGDIDGFKGTPSAAYVYQYAHTPEKRGAGINGFGRRADRDDEKLAMQIKEGSRLVLQLSARGADGCRSARFVVDGVEAAVFAGIVDDGASDDWVAGVTLSTDTTVRIVQPSATDLAFSSMASAEAVLEPELEPEEAAQLQAQSQAQVPTFTWGDGQIAAGTRPKVGDRLKVINSDGIGGGIRVGAIVTVTDDDGSGIPFLVEEDSTGKSSWSRPKAYDCTKRE
jgi:hypothetical protein